MKIITRESGVHAVSAETLAVVLGIPPAEVRKTFAGSEASLRHLGQEVTSVADVDGSTLFFYAEALRNIYTEENVYWLLGQANRPAALLDGQSPPAQPGGYYEATVDIEEDLQMVPTLAEDPEQDHWFWQRLLAGVPLRDTFSAPFLLNHLALDEGARSRLRVRLFGGMASVHRMSVELNGFAVGQGTWEGKAPYELDLELTSDWLVEGTNQVRLKALPGAAGSASQGYVDGLEVNYPRRYEAFAGKIEFSAPPGQTITVEGFSSPHIQLWDITDPKCFRVVTNLTVELSGGGYRVSFISADTQGRYAAFQAGAVPSATVLRLREWTGLSESTNQASYVAITTEALARGAGELVAWRSQQGLTGKVVTLEQIYDEFGYGVQVPQALRTFVTTASRRWSVPPRYVVLVGNGTYDYRNRQQQNDNLVPPILIATGTGLTVSDSILGDIDDDGSPEVAVGRLPVLTADELQKVTAKMQQYEAQASTSAPKALLLADRPDLGGEFPGDMRQVQQMIEGDYATEFMDATVYASGAEVRAAFLEGLDRGADFVNYLGHGASDRLGLDGYLSNSDIPGLRNGPLLPVLVAITCVAGHFGLPGYDSLSERLVLADPGGAIAVLAASGLSWNSDARLLNRRWLEAMLSSAQPRLGDIMVRALAGYTQNDERFTTPWIYNLLGDPALTYRVAVSLQPLRITSVASGNSTIEVTWVGGKPPYRVLRKRTLDPAEPWEAITGPLNDTTAAAPMLLPATFLRVLSGD